MNKIRLLPGMKFMSGGVLYRPGEILPDTEEAHALVKRKKAEEIEAPELDEVPDVTPDNPDGYESKIVKNLVEIAKERGIDIPKGTNKVGIIELLKAWDADHVKDGDDEGAS
jgi:hypothetical protein